MTARSCGSCDACCVAPELEALNKPAGVPCQHLCRAKTGSCSIYSRRPEECRTFTCVWLTTRDMPKKFRPDRCGVMLVARPNSYIQVWEMTRQFEGSELETWLRPRLGKWQLTRAFR